MSFWLFLHLSPSIPPPPGSLRPRPPPCVASSIVLFTFSTSLCPPQTRLPPSLEHTAWPPRLSDHLTQPPWRPARRQGTTSCPAPCAPQNIAPPSHPAPVQILLLLPPPTSWAGTVDLSRQRGWRLRASLYLSRTDHVPFFLGTFFPCPGLDFRNWPLLIYLGISLSTLWSIYSTHTSQPARLSSTGGLSDVTFSLDFVWVS